MFICQLPAMARAIQAIQPQGLGRNKQIVADLVRRRQFFFLSLLYGMKNKNKTEAQKSEMKTKE